MKKAMIAAMMAAMLMLLTGCRQIERGIVIGKEYDDADVHYVWSGKTMIPVFHRERFLLTVKGQDENGETVTEEWSVSESVYNAYGIGDFIVRPTE